MLKLLLLFAFAHLSNSSPMLDKNLNRHKRLLFYDEQGNLVKTFNNPLRDFSEQMEKMPIFGSFFQPFYNYIHPIASFGGRPMTYMIPVSDEVIHQVAADPLMQNKLVLLPARDPVVEMSALCVGKRAQIPSPKLCSNFLNCWDGWAFEQECPNGLLFSNDGYCDYPQKVDCNSRKIGNTLYKEMKLVNLTDVVNAGNVMLKNPPPAPPRCASDFEAFRGDQSCGEFFVCVNRVPVRFLCPADLAFNQELGICDYPERVNCSIAPAPAASPAAAPPAPAGAGDAAPPQDNAVFMRSSVYNSQSWTSHVAMSRQDAIRQLQLGRLANLKTSY